MCSHEKVYSQQTCREFNGIAVSHKTAVIELLRSLLKHQAFFWLWQQHKVIIYYDLK